MLPALNKVLRQWKNQLTQGFFSEMFVPQLSQTITDLIIQGLMSNRASSPSSNQQGGVSILGGLYIEKVLRTLKQFLQFLTKDQNRSLCEKMT